MGAMSGTRLWIVLAGALALAGCGDDLGEQALIGGAAGAGTAAVLDGDILTGVVAGAAANVALCQAKPAKCN